MTDQPPPDDSVAKILADLDKAVEAIDDAAALDDAIRRHPAGGVR